MNFSLRKPDGSFSFGALLALLSAAVGGVAASTPAGSSAHAYAQGAQILLGSLATVVH